MEALALSGASDGSTDGAPVAQCNHLSPDPSVDQTGAADSAAGVRGFSSSHSGDDG